MNKWIFFGCSFAIIAICMGAFGAHSLKDKISPYHLSIIEKGVQYQFYHCLPIVFCGYLISLEKNKFFQYAAMLFSIGIICFSGSLFMLGLRELINFGIDFILGPLTPIGGISFMLGWLFLLIGFNKKK